MRGLMQYLEALAVRTRFLARRHANPVLLVVTLLGCLFLGEIGARVYRTISPRGEPGQVTEGVFMAHDSLLGFRLLPNARTEMTSPEFTTRIEINAQGLRESEEIPPDKRPGYRRILLCGDSFTFGHGVEEEERYGERLATLLDRVEVVNQAVSGSGTDQQLLLYRASGAAFHPDLVVLAYFIDNIRRNVATVRSTQSGRFVYKPRFLLRPDGSLSLTNVPVPDPRLVPEPADEARAMREANASRRGLRVPMPFKAQMRQHSEFYRLARSAGIRLHRRLRSTDPYHYPEYEKGKEEWILTQALIRAFEEEATTSGSAFLLVLVPQRESVYRDRLGEQAVAALNDFALTEGIPIVDLLPAFQRAFRAGRRDLYYRIDPHWTAAGHTLAAECIADFLKSPSSPIRFERAEHVGSVHTADELRVQ